MTERSMVFECFMKPLPVLSGLKKKKKYLWPQACAEREVTEEGFRSTRNTGFLQFAGFIQILLMDP